jgi:DNA 3'-phosphatase
MEKSGTIATREKIHPMFKPKFMKPLDDDINYIIVENCKTSHADLCRELYCPDIPHDITVVHREWLEQCLNKKMLVDVSAYIVDIFAVPVLAIEEVIGSDEKKSLADLDSGLKSKRKRSDETEWSDALHNTTADNNGGSISYKQTRTMEFTYVDPSRELGSDFDTLLTDTGRPSLLFHFPPTSRAVFNRLIAFDMDGTLITTKSGATFSKNVDDWKFLYPEVPSILRQRYESGAHLAIISNQHGLATGHVTLEELIIKLKSITAAIGVPMDILCAFENDIYRKPRIGSFDFLLNQRVSTSAGASARADGAGTGSAAGGECMAARDPELLANCLYVGDAAGRPKQGTRKKDFSASDFKMAFNAKIDVSLSAVRCSGVPAASLHSLS